MELHPPPPPETNPSAAVPVAPPPNLTTVFAGLMLGMFLAAVNATIIAPAMPRIVAELGGMEHYSWIAVSALLASTVIVPIVGKLSDLFGRKAFYVGGILVFMASSLVAGLADGFGMFIFARILEGFGMGTMMPLSQAIIGDLVPARDRGKYQGYMGGVFGLASIIGPFVGGYITDTLSWRWLFFMNIPLGCIALGFIIPFMKLSHQRRKHTIDYAGFVTLSVGLTCVLLATVWGGTEYPWGSPTIVGLYIVGLLSLIVFVYVESKAVEPVLPLRLWKNDIFTSSNIANMAVAMGMFGAVYFIPVFAQGVLGASVTGSGAVLTPMMLSLVIMSAIIGQVISRTGHYKVPVLAGVLCMAFGFYLLTLMDRSTPYGTLMRNMIFIGVGLGCCMQVFVLVVQNAVGREDLGVATAATQLFRSIGSSVGIAILGTIMTQQMKTELPHFLSPEAMAAMTAHGGEAGAGAVLNPEIMATLSPEVLEGFREALAAALHPVFVATLPFAALALVAAFFMREIPLRRTVPGSATEAGREILAEMNQAGEADGEPVLGELNPAYQARLSFLGLLYGRLAAEPLAGRDSRWSELLARIGRGDPEQGRGRLEAIALALLRERDGHAADSDPATMLAPEGTRAGGLAVQEEFERALAEASPTLRARIDTLLSEEGLAPAALLTPSDLDTLERLGVIFSTAALMEGKERPDRDAD